MIDSQSVRTMVQEALHAVEDRCAPDGSPSVQEREAASPVTLLRFPAEPRTVAPAAPPDGQAAADDHERIMVQFVLERMRTMSRDSLLLRSQFRMKIEECNRRCAQWTEKQKENQVLRGENQTLQEEVVSLRSSAVQLAAILNSRGYRFLQRLSTIRLWLIPRGSLRERLAACAFRTLRRLVHRPVGIPAAVPVPTFQAISEPAPSRAPATAALHAGDAGHASEPATQAALSHEELGLEGANGEGPLCYTPLSWQRTPGDAARAPLLHLVLLAPVHRSGSTLLQRICNARKETIIWGEHGGLLAHFANIFATAAYFSTVGGKEREDYFHAGENPNRWIANMCPEIDYVRAAVVESAVAFLTAFYGQYREDHDLFGFKEVLYGREELELIRRCCPAAEILLLVRNPLDTWRSTPRDWYLSFDEWIGKWVKNVGAFLDFTRSDARCRLLRYEDLIRQDPKTLAVLAEAAKVRREEIESVLAHKIGSSRGSITESERSSILERCRQPMEALGYL